MLFLGTRFGTSGGLQQRPENVRVHQRGHGPAVPSSKGDFRYVCTAPGDDINSETPAVNAVRRQELDHRQNVAAVLWERIHDIRPNQQRHRGLASWAESPRVWKVPASSVPPDPPSSPRGPSDILSDQGCFRDEVTAHPEKKVPRPPNQDLQPLG